MQSGRRNRSRRTGASLVLVAVAMITVGTVAAVAIDLGMLYKARSDAQRAAESAALAGASAFVDFAESDPMAVDTAEARARRFAESNAILNEPVAPSEVQRVQVIPDSQKVRVLVGRAAVGTWFAKLLGVNSVPVNARAAAVAVSAGGGSCIKPFAIPDTWREGGQDALIPDQLEEDGENWTYDPSEDSYSPGNPDHPAFGTGYGSSTRDTPGLISDFGRLMTLKLPDPLAPTPPLGPRQVRPFSTTPNTDPGHYQDVIEGCDPVELRLGQQYPLLNDPTVPNRTQEGVDSLVRADRNATWDDVTHTVRNSDYENWRNSPRIIKVGFFDPSQLGAGQTSVKLNNIGLVFVEDPPFADNAINIRFLYFATGSGDLNNPSFGTLVKRLRLVE